MMELLMKTRLGNISGMLNGHKNIHSRIHAITLEGDRTRINFEYVKKTDRELNSCSIHFLEFMRKMLEQENES